MPAYGDKASIHFTTTDDVPLDAHEVASTLGASDRARPEEP
jgi:hypothetical protein